MKNSRLITVVSLVSISAFIAALSISADDTKSAQPTDAEEAAEKARLQLPVALVDGVPLSLAYVEAAVEKQSPVLRKQLKEDAERRKKFLERIVSMELLSLEAKRRGFDKHPEVTSVEKNQLATLMHRRLAEQVDDLEPSEAEMKKYYEEHSDKYNKPERVRARHILIKDKEKAAQVLAQATKEDITQYKFRKLAKEYSEDENSKTRGGDLTFFPKVEERSDDDPQIPDPVVNAAFAIKENGQVYEKLVKSDDGYHIIMRTGHRDAMKLSFEEAKTRLSRLVKRESHKEKVEAAVDALKSRYKVELNEENLKDVVIDLSGSSLPKSKRSKNKTNKKD